MGFKKLNIIRRAEVWPWFLVGIVCLVAFVVIFMGRDYYTEKLEEKEGTIAALTDTVKVVRYKDSSQKATITAYQTRSRKDFLQIKAQDAETKRLQSIVKSYGSKLNSGTAATFSSSSSIHTTNVTTVIPGDTLISHDTVYYFPTYASTISLGKWVQGKTLATKDSTTLTLKLYNEYDVIVGEDKGGWLRWFKKDKVYADVITHSPYDSINKMRAYKVDVPPQKKLGIGASMGVGLTATGRETFYIGVGINYNIIRIK